MHIQIETYLSQDNFIRPLQEPLYNLFQDRRIHILATSVRGAMKCGFTNGHSKSVIYDIVALVRQYGLCDRHNLRLSVYVRVLLSCVCIYMYYIYINVNQVV